jgi:hypothetical protein
MHMHRQGLKNILIFFCSGAFQPPPPKSARIQPLPGEPVFVPGNQLRNREILYRLIISQLFYDGYQQVFFSPIF